MPPAKCTASTSETPNKKRKKSEEEVKDFLMYVIVCSPDSLKLGFRCTRRLELRILWPIL